MVTFLSKLCNQSVRLVKKWCQLVESWKKTYQIIGKKVAKDRNEEQNDLQIKLNEVEFAIQNSLDDPLLLKDVIFIKHQLGFLHRYKIQGKRIRAKMNWLRDGDVGSKYFFLIIRAKQKAEKIEDIQVDGGKTNDPKVIKEAFFSFYSKLFSSEFGQDQHKELEECLKMIPKKVFDSESDKLNRKISLEEIQEVIKAMANEKSPGLDGLPIEFYKDNIDWIVEEIFLFYNDAFENGSLGNNVNRGVIKLLPKAGDRSLVKNWRAITLLNLSYKIIAKLLARRIAEITKNIVSVNQTGFIKGRYILENLITSWEAMDWAKASG